VLIIANHYDEKEIIDGMKVGIDSSSHDHFQLTMQECKGKSVQFVEISYGQALQKLVTGEIDATVWDAGAGLHRQPSNFKTVKISHHNRDSEANRKAVLIVRSDVKSLQMLISQIINPQILIDTKRKEIAKEIQPNSK